MKITKLSVIVFISLFLVALVPPIIGNVTSQNNLQQGQQGLVLDQAIAPEVFRKHFINASLSDFTRNVTVQPDVKVSLEDEFTLKIHDNTTFISVFNYTIPSSFGKYVHQANFYSQNDDNLGLDNSNNSREYSVFYGETFTTYSINIEVNGEPANDSLEAVYFKTALTTVGNVKVSTYNTGQKGIFEAPLVPMIPNLPIKDVLIGFGVAGTKDSWSFDMERYPNAVGNEMPRFSGNRLSYENMSRDAFSYNEGLISGDVTTAIFTSDSFVDEQAPEQASVVVPTTLENAKRIVRFDPWGTVFITEKITFRHDGGARNQTDLIFENLHQLAGILFFVDSDALITDVYDELGSLELGRELREDDTGYPVVTAAEIPGKQLMDVSFRNPIYGGQTYTLSIEYRYNASQVIAIDSETNQYTMNTTLFSDFNTTADHMELIYQFPAGSVYQGNSYAAKSRFVNFELSSNINRNPLSSFKHFELIFNMNNVSYTDNTGFQIYFTYNGVGHLQNLASYVYVGIIVLLAILGLSSISYKPSKAVEIEKRLIPVDEMDTFFNLFSEKSGAERRIAELTVQRRKGKLSKKDYDGKVKSIRRRLRDINPQLETASKKLSDKGGRYENYVNKVMLASQRQSDIRRNMRESKNDYERGSIPKNIYQMRIKEFNESLKQQESTINKTLAEMVEVIQRYNQE